MGVLNRCLVARLEPTCDIYDRPCPQLKPLRFGEKIKTDFDAWNKRFPEVRRRLQEDSKLLVHSEGFRSKDFLRKSFVKREFMSNCICPECEFKIRHPRIIQAASDKVNSVLGPWMWQFSKKLSRDWSYKKPLCYASGMRNETIGDWFDYHISRIGNCQMIESDLWRMDACTGEDALRFERNVYRSYGIPDKALRVVNAQAETKGFTRFGIFYATSATRKSGDPNTSCGNSLINGSILWWALLDHGIKPHQFAIIVLGDDAAILVKRGLIDVSVVVDAYKRAGYIAKSKMHDEPRDGCFCSQHFWPTADGTVLGPKVGKLLVKAGWAHQESQNITTLRSMALGLWNCCSFIPVVNTYLSRIIQLTSGIDVEPSFLHMKHGKREHAMSPDVLTWFYRWYGLVDIGGITNTILAINRLPAIIHCEALTEWVRLDTH